jgi:MerR family transcriptional regulator, thiopeptide resistance regulator
MSRRQDVRHRFLIHEFAARAGVTVKALHRYHRLGLLVPARSNAGHRIYTSGDFRRVRHIVTLKRLGVPLRRVGAILAGHGAPLDAILYHQRRALEDRRDVLNGLIRALRQVEDAARKQWARGNP